MRCSQGASRKKREDSCLKRRKPRSKHALLKAVLATGAVAGTAMLLERLFLASPPYHGPLSDHYDGRRFHNPGKSEPREKSVLKWLLTRRPGYWPDWLNAPYGPAPPERVNGGGLRITFVNHSTMLVQMDGLNILTDPIWGDRTSPVSFAGPKRHRPPGLLFRDLPPIDAVLISHNHYDHFDAGTLHRLRRRESMPIITTLGNGLAMRRYGIEGSVELDWWQETQLKDRLRITAVPACHFSSRGISDRDANLWCGFVISGPSGNVYFAGDSGWGEHFQEIGKRFAPIRAAMLPIGAYLPRWFMKPVHIDPQRAVDAHVALGAGISIPMHFGTFALGDDGMLDPARELKDALERHGETRFWILSEGEGREIPSSPSIPGGNGRQ
jgi:L-ascorbate metabolism protein UlaG (beta-lactamase superfamily)